MIKRNATIDADAPLSPAAVISKLLSENPRITQAELARAMGLSRARITQIIHGAAPITPGTALRLERVCGVSAEYWLELQLAVDLFYEKDRLREELRRIRQIATYDAERATLEKGGPGVGEAALGSLTSGASKGD